MSSSEKREPADADVSITPPSTTPTHGSDSAQDQTLQADTAKEIQDGQSHDIQSQKAPTFDRDWRFWMIMLTLAIGILLVSLENTIVITSLPTIVADLQIGSNYIWISNVFFLTSAALQPLFGQLCNLFGRKSVMVFIFAAYTLGSGIAGGANGAAMIIAGRAIQGVGSGGLNMAAEVIISDMVPLRYRGNYIAMLLLIATVGFAIGPFIGGIIVENTSWRWVFYLNLPIGGIGMVVSYFFLNLRYDRAESVMAKLRRIDYIGNIILIASTISILIALTWAGPVYPWSDGRVLAPLLIGLAGLVGFIWYEASGIPAEPVMPIRLFPNRTSRIIYLNTFLNSVLIFWCFFYLPLFFQGVQLSSPSWSGVQLLPVTLIAVPGAAISAIMLSRWGKYKVLHILGFLLMTTGVGAFAVLGKDSSVAAWVLIQAVSAIGSGFLLNTLLPAFQASLAEADQAAATGTWAFSRSFGLIWGVAVAGAVFNAYVKEYSSLIDDPAVRKIISNGDAYGSATRAFIMQFDEPTRGQIQDVFQKALQKVFMISVSFGGTAFVAALFEKDIPLRKVLDTKYGLEERSTTENEDTV